MFQCYWIFLITIFNFHLNNLNNIFIWFNNNNFCLHILWNIVPNSKMKNTFYQQKHIFVKRWKLLFLLSRVPNSKIRINVNNRLSISVVYFNFWKDSQFPSMAFDEVFTLSVKFIRLPNGFAVTIRSSETVGMLKSVIYNRIKVEPDYQTLVYAGLILHDKLNLVYYGITDRSNVYLVIKPSKSVDNLLLKSSKSVENINKMIDIEMILSRSFKDKYQSKTIQNQCTLIYRDLFYDRQENRRNGDRTFHHKGHCGAARRQDPWRKPGGRRHPICHKAAGKK